MDTYNLKLNIVLLSIPFRNFSFLENDNYSRYLLHQINYDQFIKEMFKLVSYEVNVRDMDEFILILKSIYLEYYEQNIICFYMEIITKLGATLLKLENSKVYLNDTFLHTSKDLFSSFQSEERIFIWYYLSRHIVANSVIVNHLDRFNANIEEYIDPFISKIPMNFTNHFQNSIYQEGIYETHVHFGGSIDFDSQWWYLICQGPLDMNKRNYLNNIQDMFYYHNAGFDYKLYLLASMAIRYLIIKIINTGISDFYHNKINHEYIKFVKNFNELELDEDFVLKIIDCIEIEVEKNNYINDINKISNSKDKDDYISSLIKKSGERCEIFFEYICQQYIKNNEYQLDVISISYFNYLKIKNSFYSLKVEADRTKGLYYFQEFYQANRISYMDLKDKFLHILNHYYQQKFINGIELKVNAIYNCSEIGELVYNYKKQILDFLKYYIEWIKENFIDKSLGDQKGMKIGFLITFKKFPVDMSNTCIYDYFNYGEVKNLGYGQAQYNMMLNIFAIQYLRKQVSGLEKYILGIDTAGNENNMPPSVYAQAYRSVRNSLHEIVENSYDSKLKDFYQQYDIFPNKYIGFTYHVGEVFSSIVTSFRHIDEVIERFNYLQSDRLGHALALAIDLKRYLRDKKMTQIKKIDYLMNLIWIYHLICQEGVRILSISESHLKEKIIRTARSIYYINDVQDDKITTQLLLDLYNVRFDYVDKQIRIVQEECEKYGEKCPFNMICRNSENVLESWNLSSLIASFHCKYYLRKMNESMKISESFDDYEFYNDLQQHIRKKVVSRGYVVEINPVSNSIIGNVDDVTLLPYLNFFSIGLNDENDKKVLITINTDDPAIFSTDMMFQYSLLEANFSLLQFPKKDIIDWLSYVQKNSHRSTFLDNNMKSWKNIYEEINNLIKELDEFNSF